MNELLLILMFALPTDSVSYTLPWGEVVRVTRQERDGLRTFSHFLVTAQKAVDADRKRTRYVRREIHRGFRRQ
jgi:hypothetical protein